MVPMPVRCGSPHNRKVSETRLTVPGNQDVVLDTLNISVRVYLIPHFTYRINITM